MVSPILAAVRLAMHSWRSDAWSGFCQPRGFYYSVGPRKAGNPILGRFPKGLDTSLDAFVRA